MEENRKIAIQETYGERFQHCWGCGVKNDNGLHLKSYPEDEGKVCVCNFKPNSAFTGGVPNNLFGGMIAVAFDCHGTASAAYFNHINQGLDFNEETVIQRFITARLEVDYRKPVPLELNLTIRAYPEEIGERKAIVKMDLLVDDTVYANSRIIAVKAKDDM